MVPSVAGPLRDRRSRTTPKGTPILRTVLAATLAALTLSCLTGPAAAGSRANADVVTLKAPSRLHVSQNGASYVAGLVESLTLAGRRVDLELKTATGWFPVTHTTTNALGGYRLAVPTWWYGAHTWRARVAATATSAAITSPNTVTVTVAAPKAAGRASAYSRMPGRARWDACKPVPFYFNPAKAPVGALADIRFALRQVTAGSGIRFVYRGHTKLVPWSKAAHRGMPASGLAYAFTTPRRVGELAGSTVGLGGAMYTSSPGKPSWYTSGGVAVDRTFHWSHHLLRNVLMHETGHAVGLDHVTDRREVMYPSANGSLTWGAGDLAGLEHVGLSQGCRA